MRLIDADVLIESIKRQCGICKLMPDEEIRQMAVIMEKGLIEVVNNAPTVEPKRGEWKRRIVDNGFNADWVCSECGYRVKTDFVDYNFCPNCGADMRGADDESD